jgi:hypothetical protein
MGEIVSVGMLADRELRPGSVDLHSRLRQISGRLQTTLYLNGSKDVLQGEKVYAASLQDASALWSLYVEDAREAPPSGVLWGADLERSRARLLRYSLVRKSAWVLDLLLKPVSGLLPCPFPFQRRLLRRSLERAFHDTSRFALVRDMGQPADSTVTAGFQPIRQALPRLIASGQYGPDRVSAEDITRMFRSFEGFNDYFSRWIRPDTNPLAHALNERTTLKWLYEHMVEVIHIVPEALLSKGVFGKICRSLLGVIGFKISHLPPELPQARLNEEIFESIQAGFHFGRTYLFDEIMDLDDFPREEKQRFLKAVVDLVSGGGIVESPTNPCALLVLESLQAFEPLFGDTYVRSIHNAYLALALSQIEDGKKSFDAAYSEKEIYAPLMVKSAYTRILPAILGRLPITPEFLSHAYAIALPNQLVDDFRDLADDQASNTFTPYTYYVRARSTNPDLRHPLSIYLHAISLVVRKFGGQPDVRKLWLSRFVQALRVFELKGGLGSLDRFFENHPHGGKEFQEQLLGLVGFSNLVVDPEGLLASLASAASMQARGMSVTRVAGH